MLKKLLYISLLFVALGCSEYQKVLKSTDLDYKYNKAVEYYNDAKYNKAYPLFDELLTLYRGTQKAADVYYYFAYTNYKLNDYILAAYHFKNFSNTFPSHEKAEEMAFMVGYCYYLESPPYSLDQAYTFKAINEIQLFVNTHPNSEKLAESNKLIIELRRKLEKKSFELALLYFKTQYYQSAVVAFNNTLNNYPDTRYREEILFFKFQASYELAKNSIDSKKLQRFIESRTAYLSLVDNYPENAGLKDIEQKFTDVQLQIKNLKNQS
jgi:outer membrane protein assembly factor BamD